jgi:hypothetical protein
VYSQLHLRLKVWVPKLTYVVRIALMRGLTVSISGGLHEGSLGQACGSTTRGWDAGAGRVTGDTAPWRYTRELAERGRARVRARET